MGMGFAPTWLRQVSPPASQNHFYHWLYGSIVIWIDAICHHFNKVLCMYVFYSYR